MEIQKPDVWSSSSSRFKLSSSDECMYVYAGLSMYECMNDVCMILLYTCV